MARWFAVPLGLVVTLVVAGGGRADPQPPPSAPAATEPGADRPAPKAAILDAKALAEVALEHSRARDALLAAEARLSLLMEKVFDSRLVVRYEGDLDTDYQLALVELTLDGALAYRREFDRAASVQALKLFDGYLPPGRHVLQIHVHARGPDDPPGGMPGYYAGCGMTVHLRKSALTEALFEAEQDGDSPGTSVYREDEPEGDWEIEISGEYQTSVP